MSATKQRAQAHAAALSAARTLLASVSADPNHVGDLAWWVNVSSWSAASEYAATVFAAHGIDPDATLPPAPDWKGAHARAILTTAAHARAEGFTLLDAAPGPAGERRTSIVRIKRNGLVTTDDEATVSTPASGEEPSRIERTDTAAGEKVAQALLAAIQACHDTYRSDDMRIACVAWLELHSAILVRPGLYWIAPAARPAIDAFDAVATALGWGTVEAFEGRRDRPRTMRAVRSLVMAGLQERIEEIRSDVQRVTRDPKARAATLQERTPVIQRAREDARMLANVIREPAIAEATRGALDSLDSDIALALARGANARSV